MCDEMLSESRLVGLAEHSIRKDLCAGEIETEDGGVNVVLDCKVKDVLL